jgi:hypothetical protein
MEVRDNTGTCSEVRDKLERVQKYAHEYICFISTVIGYVL